MNESFMGLEQHDMRVNDDRIFIFGRTNPLTSLMQRPLYLNLTAQVSERLFHYFQAVN